MNSVIKRTVSNEEQSLLQSIGPTQQEKNEQPQEPIYTSGKFKRELLFLSVGLSFLMLGAFIPIFVYFLVQGVLNNDSIDIPNMYIITNIENSVNSVILTAQYTGQQMTQYPDIFQSVQLNITLASLESNIQYLSVEIGESDSSLQSNIVDQDSLKEYAQSYNSLYSDLKQTETNLGQFGVQYSDLNNKLGFSLTRLSTKEQIFNTIDFDVIVSQYFSTISSVISTGYFYGLGERRIQDFPYNREGPLNNCTYGNCSLYRFWNKDPNMNTPLLDEGYGPGQLAGNQPLYLIQEESLKYSLFYLDQNSGMEVGYYQYTNEERQDEALEFRVFSSKISFKIFLGDELPNNVVKQYHEFLGGYSIIPFWGLGFHYGKTFTSVDQTKQFFLHLSIENMPIDAIWTGLEQNIVGDQFKLINTEIIQIIQTNYFLKWIPTIPTALTIDLCSATSIAELENILIISNKTNQPIISEGFAGKALFIDFNHPNSLQVWGNALNSLYDQAQFDGVLLSSNEPYLQLTGEYIKTQDSQNKNDGDSEYTLNTSNGIFDSIYKNLTNLQFNDHLLNTDALHYNQEDALYSYIPDLGNNQYELDMHSINGYMQTATTYQALKNILKIDLPFVVGASNSPGTGKYGAHTTGYIGSKWIFLQSSFQEAFNFQIYNQPFSGSDVCPITSAVTTLNSVAELCARWYQLGSVLPLMHSYPESAVNFDILSFTEYPYVLQSVTASLRQRYSLLKHYYSLYVMSQGIGMIFQPVSFVFPTYQFEAYVSILTNNTAMIGDSLYVFTVTTPGDSTKNTTTVWMGFPPGLWVDVSNSNQMFKGPFTTKQSISFSSRPIIFLREGSLVFWQGLVNTGELIRSSKLSSLFQIRAVGQMVSQNNLLIQYSSAGKILGIIDYNDSQTIDICFKSGCQLLASMTILSTNNNLLTVEMSFITPEGEYFEPGIIITEINITGIIKYNQILLDELNEDLTNTPYSLITVQKSLDLDNQWVLEEKNSIWTFTIEF